METHSGPSPGPVDLRFGILRRVAASASFQRSPRLRELLTYICERALDNRTQDLRERAIGCVVFGRKGDYSPGEDNIVRVEVRQLRKRLEEYFAGEGKDEPYSIEIPKGAYIPVFEPRATRVAAQAHHPHVATPALAVVQTPAITASPPVVLPPVAVPVVGPASEVHRPLDLRWWAISASALAAMLAVCCFWLWSANRAVARTGAPSSVERTALWPYLFNEQRGTTIVCADTSLVVVQGLLRRSITLDEYLSREYLRAGDRSDGTQRLLQQIPNWQFTDLADVRLVQRLFLLNTGHWDKVAIRSAKTMQIQDFTGGNTVLLGSNRSNPWSRMFEPMLNFHFDYDEAQGVAFIRNNKPLLGEQPTYRAALPGKSGDGYGIVALAPNLRRTGNVLMIGGTTAEATESAGEFIMSGASSSALLATLTQRNQGRLPYFEVLLRSGTFSGIAKNAEAIAFRIIPVAPAQLSLP